MHCGSFMWIAIERVGTMARGGLPGAACTGLLRRAHRRDRVRPDAIARAEAAHETIGRLIAALAALLAPRRPARRASPRRPPIEVAAPLYRNFSPTFFWSDEPDFVRTGSTTCPKGRAITGGLSILQGKASLRILESYPDGESWVVRIVNRPKPDSVQSLQVRGFALCMLPVARKSSVPFSQHPRLPHVVSPVQPPLRCGEHDRSPGLPAGRARHLRRVRVGPETAAGAAQRLELVSRSERLEHPRAQRCGRGGRAAEVRVYGVCIGGKEGADIRNYQTIYFTETEDLEGG